MVYQESEKTKLKRERAKEAINLAMQGRWEEAVAVNKALLELFPTDVEAHNRLGRALMELGDYAEAEEAYAQALKLGPNNLIAQKKLRQLSEIRESQSAPKANAHKIDLQLFSGEGSKVGVVNLTHLAPKKILMRVTTGTQVDLKLDGENLWVCDEQSKNLGRIEPKYESRLARLMAGGNRYAAAIASVGDSEIRVLIRESYQHPSQADQLSFFPAAMEGFRPDSKDSLIKYESEEEYGEGEEELPKEETGAGASGSEDAGFSLEEPG